MNLMYYFHYRGIPDVKKYVNKAEKYAFFEIKSIDCNDDTMSMIRMILLIFMASMFAITIYAQEQRSRTFTNADIEKYGKSSASTPPETRDSGKTDYHTLKIPVQKRPSVESRNRHVVPYTGSSRRIIIPVTFNGRVTAPMLLDTGAPSMHISYVLAEKLGIIDSRDSELQVRIGGIGGTTPAILTIVDAIAVGQAEAQFIPTFVSESISPNFEGLIGMGFLTKYSIRIDTQRRVVIFEELPEDVNMPGGHDEAWWRSTFENFKSIKTAWGDFRNKLARHSQYTDQQREWKMFVNRQYDKAEELCNRLSVYASQHSVPLEWR